AEVWNIFHTIDTGDRERAIETSLNAPETAKVATLEAEVSEFLLKLPLGIAGVLSEPELAVTVAALTRYLRLEQRKLGLYQVFQREMNGLLGHSDDCRPPDGLDISRMYNRKLRDVLAEFFSIEIENCVNETIIRQGEEKFLF